MENQKIINILNKDDTDSKHFATKKWYIINDENNTNYGVNKDTGENNSNTIKYDTRALKPINDEHVDTAENLDIVMPMYNLIEYSDNYQDSSATLYQYKRDEPPEGDPIPNLAVDNSSSFKYKVELLGD